MKNKNVKIIASSIVIVILVSFGFIAFTHFSHSLFSEKTSVQDSETRMEASREFVSLPLHPTDYRTLFQREVHTTEIIEGLDAPWAFVWLPNGDMLVTEIFGNVQLVRGGVAMPVEGVPTVFASGQGGLLDVTIHPDFSTNRLVYLSYVHGNNEANRLRVARAELRDTTLQNVEILFEVAEAKSGSQHFGSRFAWLPDTTLLFSVGDGGNPPTRYDGALIREQAQHMNAHLGKIIRINDDGSIPADNPFMSRPDVKPEIYTLGHRNIQGITYDGIRDQVIATEHGSLGGDEFNIIRAGENYGWPVVAYGTEYDAFGTAIGEGVSLPHFTDPHIAWTPTIAPSSVVSYSGSKYNATGDVFIAAMLLRSNATLAAYATRPAGGIIRLLIDDTGVIERQEVLRLGEYRVRSIGEGPDGYLYALIDTTERQNRPGMNAGKIVRIESF